MHPPAQPANPPLSPPASDPLAPKHLNVAAWLGEMARADPYRRAVVCPAGRDRAGRVAYSHLTCAGLDRESDAFARGLARAGVVRGMRVVLMVKPSLEFFALTFALFKIGAAIVMVDPGIGVKNLGKCLAEAEPEAFVGIAKAQIARRLLGWARRTIRIVVSVDTPLRFGGARLADLREESDAPFPMCDPAPDDPAAILFTSGSTGVPKGAIYTHGIFAWQVSLLREMFGIEPGTIDLGTFPLFALFGPALGMTAVVPDMDASRPASADPRKLIEAIEDHGVSQMFGSPALIDRLARHGAATGAKLPSVQRAMSAGAPVRPEILERFRAMLPDDARVWTPYGATEALPVAAIESREILGETRAATDAGKGVCVGRPAPRVEVRIVRIDDGPIPNWTDDLELSRGEIGEIVVRGPVVTRAYFNRDEQTSLSKIRGAESDGGGVWHRMGDVGYLDESGRLWFCGRKSHRVETKDGTLFTIPCEAIFNRHPDVFRTALVGVGPKGAKTPVLWVELEKDLPPARRDEAKIRRELLELGAANERPRTIRTILFHPAFPVDIRHNAKIGREKLAARAEKLVGRGRASG